MAKRLALEVLMGGGKVSNNLAHASHLVVLAIAEDSLNFTSVSKRYFPNFCASDIEFRATL